MLKTIITILMVAFSQVQAMETGAAERPNLPTNGRDMSEREEVPLVASDAHPTATPHGGIYRATIGPTCMAVGGISTVLGLGLMGGGLVLEKVVEIYGSLTGVRDSVHYAKDHPVPMAVFVPGFALALGGIQLFANGFGVIMGIPVGSAAGAMLHA